MFCLCLNFSIISFYDTFCLGGNHDEFQHLKLYLLAVMCSVSLPYGAMVWSGNEELDNIRMLLSITK